VVTGTVRVKLYKGNCTVVGRKSISLLTDQDLRHLAKMWSMMQKDAGGFIKLNALRLRIRAMDK